MAATVEPTNEAPRRRRLVAFAAGAAVVLLIAAVVVVVVARRGDDVDPPDGSLSIGRGAGGADVEVAYREAMPTGGATDATEPTVLFLHGSAYTSAIWDERGILDDVADAGHRAVAIDLPGAGNTSFQEVDDPTAFLDAVIDGLGGAPVVLVAPSASGRFALPYLSAHPDRLAGFIPVAPVGGDSFEFPAGATAPPTVIVLGESDDGFRAGTERLATEIPGATLEVIPDAGHAAYDDEPAAFTDIVEGVLSRQPVR